MKRKKNLYKDILKYEHILDIVKIVSKTTKNKKELLNFKFAQNIHIYEIFNKLWHNDYHFSSYHIFLIKEPKYRIIMSENINDKIVNHLVSKYILLPSIEPCCIDTNVATRKNKGSEYAFKKFYQYIRQIGFKKPIYVLKIDISKYFYNINHFILMDKLSKKIKDKSCLDLIKSVLDTTNDDYINDKITSLINNELKRLDGLNLSYNDRKNKEATLKSLPHYQKNRGLPIGNMTSQILAVFYLNDVDHFIKEDLKCHHYIRYMDDFVILDTNKDKLKYCFKEIKKKILKNDLQINNKSNIYSLRNGISFLGYTFKVTDNGLKIRYNNATIRRISRHLRGKKVKDYNHFFKSKASYIGYFKKCNTALYYGKYKKMEVNNMYEKYLDLKKEYPCHLILLKRGKFYRSFDDDAMILSYIMDYQIIDNRVGFPLEGLFKVKNKIRSYSIDLVILDGDQIIKEQENDHSNYETILKESYAKYHKNLKIDELCRLVREKLESNIDHYDSLKEYVEKI